MNRILELRQNRAALIEQAGALLTVAANEKRALTVEETEKYNRLHADAEAVRKTIEAEEHQASAVSSIENVRREHQDRTGVDVDQQRDMNRRAIASYLLTGTVSDEFRAIMLPGSQFEGNFRNAAQTVGTGSTGGYTVPQGFYGQVIAAMKFFGGIRASRAKVITTTSGNALPIPTSDDTGNTGRLLAENTSVTNTEVSFGQVTLNAYKWSSDILLVPFELLQDTGVDLEAFLVSRLAERLGRVQNTYFTTGTGSSQPQGIVTGSTLGKTGAGGQTTSIIYNDLIDLKYSVNRAYRQNAEWMMNDTSLATILKLVDGASRPLFESQYTASLQSGEPDRLFNQPLVINSDMANMAASAKSVLYGDFGNYWVRDVSAMLLLRLVERYADAGQVGFVAFTRADGRMVDAGQHPVKHYAHPAS
jgi:HK97 family phage major capsid protein